MVISGAQKCFVLYLIKVFFFVWSPSAAYSQLSDNTLPPVIYGKVGGLMAKVQGSEVELLRQQHGLDIKDSSGLNEIMSVNQIAKITLTADKIELFNDTDTEESIYTIQTHLIDPSPVFSAMPTGFPEVDQSPALLRLNSTTLDSLKQTITTITNPGDYSRQVEPSSTPTLHSGSGFDEPHLFSYAKTEVSHYPSPTPSPSKTADEIELEAVRIDHEEGDYLLILPTPSETGSAGYSFTWQPKQVAETDEQASGINSQSETSTSTQSTSGSICEPTPAVKSKVSYSQLLEYQGHRLQAENEYERNLSDKNCTICLESLREEKKPLIKLNCGHVYHDDCIHTVIACPECRTCIDRSASAVYSSFEILEADCQLSCRNEQCLWCGSFQLLREHDSCPYPYGYLDESASGDFFSKSRDFIIAWLKEVFKRKKYTVHEITYYEKLKDYDPKIREESAEERPCISMVLSHKKLLKEIRFYYSAEDCEKGRKSDVECFQYLISDIRTDLVFTHLKASYAAMFDYNTNMYIWHYELWENRLLLSVNKSRMPIPLDRFWNPEQKDFNFSKLREAMEEQGLIYADLFKGSPEAKSAGASGLYHASRHSRYDQERRARRSRSREGGSGYSSYDQERRSRSRSRDRRRELEAHATGEYNFGSPRAELLDYSDEGESFSHEQPVETLGHDKGDSGTPEPQPPEDNLNLDWLL